MLDQFAPPQLPLRAAEHQRGLGDLGRSMRNDGERRTSSLLTLCLPRHTGPGCKGKGVFVERLGLWTGVFGLMTPSTWLTGREAWPTDPSEREGPL